METVRQVTKEAEIIDDPVVVLQRVLDRMTPENWESSGWGGVKYKEGAKVETACLLHQIAIAAGAEKWAEGLSRESSITRALKKTVGFMRQAIKKRFGEKWGLNIIAFNDSADTNYEDARLVVKEALEMALSVEDKPDKVMPVVRL